MEDNRLPKQLMFREHASGKRKQGRPLRIFKDCVKTSISHAEPTPKELEPRPHNRTGWRALTRHAMDTFEEMRRTQIEEARERRKASADGPGNPGLFPCPHCPGPASLVSDSTATSVSPADGATLKTVFINFDGLLPHIS